MEERKSAIWSLSEGQESDQSALTIDSDGSIYLIDSSHEYTYITKHSPDNKTSYSKHVQYLTRGCTFMDAMVAESGDIYAVGSRYNYNLSCEMPVVVRISPDGNVLSTYAYDHISSGKYHACVWDTTFNCFYVVGSIVVNGIDRGILVKISSNGIPIWEHVFTDPTLNGSILHGVVIANGDGGVYVVGTSYHGYNPKFGFVSRIDNTIDDNNIMTWLSIVNVEDYTNCLKGIAITEEGNIYVVGTVNERPKNPHGIELDYSIMGLIIELNHCAELKWHLGVKSGDVNSFDGICINSSGHLIIVGREMMSVEFDDVNFKGKHVRRHRTYSSGTISVIQGNNELTLYNPIGYDTVSSLTAVVCRDDGSITAIGHSERYERCSVISSIGNVSSFRMRDEAAEHVHLSTLNITLNTLRSLT